MNRFNQTSFIAVTPTNHSKLVHNRRVIVHFDGVLDTGTVLSLWGVFFSFSVANGHSITGLSQISSPFSFKNTRKQKRCPGA